MDGLVLLMDLRRSGAICRRVSALVDRSARPLYADRRRRQEAHSTDVLRAPDLHAREDLRADQVPGRTRTHPPRLRARHVRGTSEGIYTQLSDMPPPYGRGHI